MNGLIAGGAAGVLLTLGAVAMWNRLGGPARRRDDRVPAAERSTDAGDISRQGELEAQLRQAQRLAAIGRLAGGVAHDFNNILTVILGWSNVAIERPGMRADVLGDLGEIRHAAESGAALTRQLLVFSRVRAARPVVLDLNDIVTRVNQMLRRLVGAHIEIGMRLAPDAGHVEGDFGQIEQVVMNLVINARDAMPSGGRLTIDTARVAVDDAQAGRHDAAGGDFATLTVSDTGEGMPPEIQARMFEPFFTTKDQERGSGIGLATVEGIVKQARGWITVSSAVGRGTSITVFLPRVAPAADAAAPALQAEGRRAVGTILFVEDDDSIRALGARELGERGYTVLTARQADEALELVGSNVRRIDLLVTDVVLPDISGQALAAVLRARHPALKVLFTSGYADDPGVLGGDPLLQKPYAPRVFVHAVHQALQQEP